MIDRQSLTEGIDVLYRVHVYLYRQWYRQWQDSWGPRPHDSDEGLRLALKVIVDVRHDMLDERDRIDESMQGIA